MSDEERVRIRVKKWPEAAAQLGKDRETPPPDSPHVFFVELVEPIPGEEHRYVVATRGDETKAFIEAREAGTELSIERYRLSPKIDD